jgi:hypothetical protein
MQRNCRVVIFLFILLIVSTETLSAKNRILPSGEIKRDVQAEGACAIVGMSAEQSQLLALQRARASVIEQAAGVSVSSSTIVTNYVVAVDYIKTYAKGFIISEKAIWLPLGQYQKDQTTAPIPEYRVKIIADVYIPVKKTKPLGLKAKLNTTIFRSGEKASVTVSVVRESRLAIFNIMANDRVAMLFPNLHETDNLIMPKHERLYPARDSKVDIEIHALPGHEKDAEAIFVVAVESSQNTDFMDLFAEAEPMGFGDFFKKLSEISDYSEDLILPYEVVGQEK